MSEVLYESISNDIMFRIKKGLLKESDMLSERKIADEYGVSRTVIRDAFKVLHEKGYLSIRTGKGHYVKLPDQQDFRGTVGNLIVDCAIPNEVILEARELIENALAPLIIERVDRANIKQLKSLYEEMEKAIDDQQLFCMLDEKFHVAIMECCHNEMLLFFIQTLNDATNRNNFLWERTIRQNAQQEHFQMLQAVISKDEPLLREFFHKHICCIREHINAAEGAL